MHESRQDGARRATSGITHTEQRRRAPELINALPGTRTRRLPQLPTTRMRSDGSAWLAVGGPDALHRVQLVAPLPVGAPVARPDRPVEAITGPDPVKGVNSDVGVRLEGGGIVVQRRRYVGVARRAVTPARPGVARFGVEADLSYSAFQGAGAFGGRRGGR
ncbi:hypothetical protein STRAU_6624 [Streptomyces aurantiacus JA 4570]|uniref:Uncharacterized protein n=1 Tax=Streptomyces aurantiacus JA 4570 TaxID=1286094 RepID=S3Z9G3_9ACTN|nr:hypothetical protein STRAU_6624 [Streptomyces aurantiacus JA 4570]